MLDMLFVHWHVDPVLFHIGNLQIRWYSLLFASGFVIGWYLFKWFFKREKLPLELLDSLLYTLLIATIVGARLGHCIFYQPDYYFGSWKGFLEIFMPWKGGLASHGGAIALLLAMWWYSSHYGKKNNFDFLWIMDRLCIAVAFAGCFIRCGNLMNSEIYGHVTDLPWGFVFVREGETLPAHPTQIYEALCYFALFALLMWMYWKRNAQRRPGLIFGVFFTILFASRFVIEYIKNVQEPWEIELRQACGMDMGQVLSIPFIIAGIALIVYALRRPAVHIDFPGKFPEDKKINKK